MWLPIFFHVAAFSNWLLACLTLFQRALFYSLHIDPPRYAALFVMGGAWMIVFGVLYWDIADKPAVRPALLKIALLSKAAPALIWLIGLMTHDLPPVFWGFALISDFLWLPGFVYYYVTELEAGKKKKFS